jgi:ABC-2 type transport system permease protein
MSRPQSNARRTVRQTLTIARRDFTATVFTPTFLLFLLSPVFMLSFSLVGAGGASSMASGANEKTQIVAIVAPAQTGTIAAVDARLRKAFAGGDAPPHLAVQTAGGDPAAQAHAAFDGHATDASAALYGDLAHPTILYGGQGRRDARYLAELAESTLRAERSGAAPLSSATLTAIARNRASASGHGQAAFFSVLGIFFLSLLLSGQAVGTMAEERNNKVVEVLAAAVPLEALFFGKLIGMFGSAILFVAFWGTLVSQIPHLMPAAYAGALGEIGPAVGLPMFALLFFAYFAMAYMLLGAVFLGIGAQATTPRELQMLSLPITLVQVMMFGLALRAAAYPDTTIARVAEIFPFSSPFAMAAHAANSAELWPHAAALAWQALWVVIAITIGARAFRRGVLQSGSGRIFRRRKPVDMGVS